MKSVSIVIGPVGRTKITGTVISTRPNSNGTFNAINFEGTFYGSSLGSPLSGTYNNAEIFEDSCESSDVRRVAGSSWYLAGTTALYRTGVSGGGYKFGSMIGTKKTPSGAQGFDLGVDFMIGMINTKGPVYQYSEGIFKSVNY